MVKDNIHAEASIGFDAPYGLGHGDGPALANDDAVDDRDAGHGWRCRRLFARRPNWAMRRTYERRGVRRGGSYAAAVRIRARKASTTRVNLLGSP